MRYLLDTCVISDFVKGEPNTLKRMKADSPNEIAVSTITLMEIEYGLANNPERSRKIRPVLEQVLSRVHILSFTEVEAEQVANIRHALKVIGQPIGAYDLLIAGTAMSHNLIMVTANTREFERVTGLLLENWRVSS